MKKTLLIVAIAGLAMASCKKDRTCTCTITPSAGTVTTETTKFYSAKKSEARLFCLGSQETTTDGTTTVTGSNKTCTLK